MTEMTEFGHPTDSAADIRRRAEQWRAFGRDPDSVELIGLLRAAAHRVIAGSEEVLAAHGLTRGQFDVLSALYRSGQGVTLTQADLANAMLITPAGMKKRIDVLVNAGLLERMADSSDSRKQLLRLTTEGVQVVGDLLDEFFRAEDEALAPLSSRDRLGLRGLLRALIGE